MTIYQPDLPLIVDSFAGGGGASTAIEMALGRSPDYAINHSEAALALHAANHPDTKHLNANIWDIDPARLIKGRPFGLLWASPDCKHFSIAAGGRPKDRNIRDLAWKVVEFAEFGKPDLILMENVREFQTWGPLDNDGKPIKEMAGITFELWISRLKKAGYKVQFKELRCHEYGDPTIRKRFFMIARRDGRPIVWPKPTHGDPRSQAVKRGKLKPWRISADQIDFSLPCPSIFDTEEQIKEKHGLGSSRPLADATMARIARGMEKFVLGSEAPFVVQVPGQAVTAPVMTYGQQGGRNRPADAPLHTVTASSKDQNALIAATMVHVGNGERKGQAPRTYDLHSPLGTIVASGTKHYPVAAFLAQHNKARKGVNPGRPVKEPIATITATGSQQSLVAPYIARNFRTGTGHRIDAPASTFTADGGGKSSLITPWLLKYYGTGKGAPVTDPLHTITGLPRMAHLQAELSAPPFTPEHEERAREVAEFLRAYGAWDGGEFVTVAINGEEFVVVDIGMRMLTPRELFNCQGFPSDYVIEGVWHQDGNDWNFQKFSKKTQVSCCGNSVPPNTAAALVAANAAHLAAPRNRHQTAVI